MSSRLRPLERSFSLVVQSPDLGALVEQPLGHLPAADHGGAVEWGIAAGTRIHVRAVAAHQPSYLDLAAHCREIKRRQAVDAGARRERRICVQQAVYFFDPTECSRGVTVKLGSALEQQLEDGTVAHLGGGLERGFVPACLCLQELRVLVQQCAYPRQVAVRVADELVRERLIAAGWHRL